MSAVRIALAKQLNEKAAPAEPVPKAQRLHPPSIDGRYLREFTELYSQYFPKVFAYIHGRVQDKEAALDVASDVFEKAFVHRQSLRSPDAFSSWLFTVARNEVASHWRKENLTAKVMQKAASDSAIHHEFPNPEEALLHKGRIQNLTLHLRELSHREREIISLKFDAGLTSRETAEILKTSEINVRVTLFRALRKLRQRMHADEGPRR